MKTVSYANVLGFFGAICLLINTRFMAIGESQLTPVHYWVAVAGGVLLTIVGISFSTMPKWAKVVFLLLQIAALCLCIYHKNSIHEVLFLFALISLAFLFIPVMVWMNLHMIGGQKITK